MEQEAIKGAVLVVAHPDDEILWFSSILTKVKKVIICYSETPFKQEWSIGRQKSFLEYPLKNVEFLKINESGVFGNTDWVKPEPNEFGLKLYAKTNLEQNYIRNFYQIRSKLRSILKGTKDVITHNPWGEYGNEEHVQVYRIIENLKTELKFRIWFSNYVSNKSIILFGQIFPRLDGKISLNPTNKTIANEIKHIYLKNGCWTWYKDWEWRQEEGLICEFNSSFQNNVGFSLPFNIISVKPSKKVQWREKFFFRLLRKFKKVIFRHWQTPSSGTD